LVDKLPRNHVFVPSEGVFIESLTDSYRTFDVHVAEVVGGQRNFVSDGASNGRHEFAHLFDSVNFATETVMTAELFDLGEESIDVTRIFADEAAFEHQCVVGGCAISNFAGADDALVGFNFDEWPALSKTVAAYYGNFEISDSEA
jgi:hypothetical protein